MSAGAARFRAAARAYFVYGVVYWLGGAWLWLHDVGRGPLASVGWILLGAVFVVLVPYLLRRRRPGFERWVLSRTDFARIVAVLLLVRIVAVARVVVRSAAASVAAPWGGTVSYRTGGAVFLVVTVVAFALVARAAWAQEA
ncbi:MAG TPA: hypothetical protein VFL90_02405 [Methylomirabilota bacterium]|nr:hypothetical protein [Methylomirabilota bacterium]